MKQIDTRGLSCPQPLIMVTKAMQENNESLKILIDNETAAENILRTLKNKFNTDPEIKEEQDYIIYIINR